MDVQSGDQRQTMEEKTYVTGSHLPARNGTSGTVTTPDVKTAEDVIVRGKAAVQTQ